MRKRTILLCAVCMVGAAVTSITTAAPPPNAADKELCLLYARECADKVYHLQKKIDALKEEIGADKSVYRPEELKNLREKLQEAEKLLNQLTPNKK